MRKQGDWMANWDDRFLEFIYDHGGGTPKRIADNEYINVSRQYVAKRLRDLYDHELLEKVGRGSYRISTKGEYYLGGAYDAEKEKYIEEELRNYEYLLIKSQQKMDKFKQFLDETDSDSPPYDGYTS